MNVESLNGYEAWRLLVKREEPAAGAVQVSQMSKIVNTTFTGKLETFVDELERLEGQIKRYENTHSEIVSDSLAQALMKSNAPAEIRTNVELQTFPSAAALKEQLVAYAQPLLSKNPTPMVIGGVKGGKKGKKGKDSKGKWGKSNKSKDGKFKGKQFGSGKGKSAQPFNGYCNSCWQWGHRKRDCPQRQQEGASAMDTGAVDATGGQTQQQANQAPGVGAVFASSPTAMETEEGWIY